jgi:DNA polymerase sigma
VSHLLVDFFYFYVEKFKFMDHVVSIQSSYLLPYFCLRKEKIWGKQQKKLQKTWRISIQDPFETKRDLGSVVQAACQTKIVKELKRALTLLIKGEDFLTVICQDATKKQHLYQQVI